MSKTLYFFMNKEDLISMSDIIEKQIDVAYIRNHAYHQTSIKGFGSITDFPDLGLNMSGNQQNDSYIVLEKNVILIGEK